MGPCMLGRNSCGQCHVHPLRSHLCEHVLCAGNAQRPVGTVTPVTSEPTTVTRRSQTRRLRLSSNPFPRAVELSWLEGLQELPASHGPDSRDWTNSFALCATMKDENITDVVEWLTYYRCGPHRSGFFPYPSGGARCQSATLHAPSPLPQVQSHAFPQLSSIFAQSTRRPSPLPTSLATVPARLGHPTRQSP